MLDQSRLPHEVSYIECTDYRMVAECIKTLKTRGAPLIGIAAAMGVALGALDVKAKSGEELIKGLEPVFKEMLSTRPTAVNIKWAVDRMKGLLASRRGDTAGELRGLLAKEALDILKEDVEANMAIGRFGAKFIKDGDSVLTHCNAGSLATGGYGTATAAIYAAKEEGKKIHVFVDETRPVLQGARLTAWELMEEGVPCTLITDNSAGALMRKAEIDLAIVGTDRTARNGDVANKIGTYTVAVLCLRHGVPFYVAAPISSIDFSMETGEGIPIEERPPEEVTSFWGLRVAPEGVRARNMAFDVTPAELVTAIITEKGAFRPGDLWMLSSEGADLAAVRL